MPQKYTPEEIEKNLKNLPEDLKEAVFSMETADAIWQACIKQEVTDERMTKIAEYAGYVLMGLLPPQEFQTKLQEEIRLPKKGAEELGREINRLVFSPVRPALEQLYMTVAALHTIESAPPKPVAPLQKKQTETELSEIFPARTPSPTKTFSPETKQKNADSYREQIE